MRSSMLMMRASRAATATAAAPLATMMHNPAVAVLATMMRLLMGFQILAATLSWRSVTGSIEVDVGCVD